MVIDPKVLVGTDDDDGLGVGKISFGESFFSSWRKFFFVAKELAKVIFVL